MEHRPYLVGTILGAVVGAAIGYAWSTHRDRFSVAGARRLIDQLSGELQYAQALWLKVSSAVGDYNDERRRAYRYGVFDVVDFDSQAGAR